MGGRAGPAEGRPGTRLPCSSRADSKILTSKTSGLASIPPGPVFCRTRWKQPGYTAATRLLSMDPAHDIDEK